MCVRACVCISHLYKLKSWFLWDCWDEPAPKHNSTSIHDPLGPQCRSSHDGHQRRRLGSGRLKQVEILSNASMLSFSHDAFMWTLKSSRLSWKTRERRVAASASTWASVWNRCFIIEAQARLWESFILAAKEIRSLFSSCLFGKNLFDFFYYYFMVL